MFSVVSKQKRQVFGIQLSGRGLAQLKALGLIRQYDKANDQENPSSYFFFMFIFKIDNSYPDCLIRKLIAVS